ncbi:MAG: phytoene/squalene synthase family protein [Candidatus Caldarchaeum sp.]|nr:phytoene/squalene synthase family protein [Candidatus Caldarchaeum sp.]MDW7977752.1 phytoene/squalene synthase family protein [Candidatus Caldarchaeum sp.]
MLLGKTTELNPEIVKLFKKGSKTYFNSSLFFPAETRAEVFRLYAFVRKADNYVDSIPQDVEGFHRFRREYERAAEGNQTSDIVVREFVALAERHGFERRWVDAFLDAMEADLYHKTYYTVDELCGYMYGSAEVVGLFMAKIMRLPKESYVYARHLGRAMQYINFIRDVREDFVLGRHYLPLEELREYGIESFDPYELCGKLDEFSVFIRKQIDRYFEWQRFAEKGYRYIPYRFLIPIKTASDMYKWTARIIYRTPWIVFIRKVKPWKPRIIYSANINFINVLKHKVPLGGVPWP